MWGRPEETEQTFRATGADDGEGPFLRTGDLGFLMHGQLFIAGRIKDMIIIRGANHHPQDIEWTVQASHPAMRPEAGAAFSVVIEGDEKLVVAQEVEREYAANLQAEGIARVVRQAIAESHDLDLFALLLLARGSHAQDGEQRQDRRQACRGFFLHGGPQDRWDDGSSRCATGVRPASRAVRDDDRRPTVAGKSSASPTGTEPPMRRDADARRTREVSRTRADELIGWLRGYAADRINSRLMDERRCIPPSILLDFGNQQSLMGMHRCPGLTGPGQLRHVDSLRVLEQLAAIDLTLATVVFLNATNGIRPIQGYATPPLREELLPRLASGRELASFALSEPAAGANVGGIATQAPWPRRTAADGESGA